MAVLLFFFAGKALPGDLTFSQLMQILLQRGLAPGTTALPFTITLSTRTSVPPPTLQAALAAAQQGETHGHWAVVGCSTSG